MTLAERLRRHADGVARYMEADLRAAADRLDAADRARAEALEEAAQVADAVAAAWQRRRPENSAYTDGNRNAAQNIASAIRALGKETGQ